MCDHINGAEKTPSLQVQEDMDAGMEDFMDDALENEVLQMFIFDCMDKIKEEPKDSKNQQNEDVQANITKKNEDDTLMAGSIDKVPRTKGPTLDVNVSCCMTHTSWKKSEEEAMTAYIHLFWTRATTKILVKLGDLDELVLTLVDYGLKINIVSKKIYEKGKWPIDVNHGWVLRAANNERGNLYGACPAVKTKIGDVEVEQNFFVQNHGSYIIILSQLYITVTRMETKVLDDGSYYA